MLVGFAVVLVIAKSSIVFGALIIMFSLGAAGMAVYSKLATKPSALMVQLSGYIGRYPVLFSSWVTVFAFGAFFGLLGHNDNALADFGPKPVTQHVATLVSSSESDIAPGELPPSSLPYSESSASVSTSPAAATSSKTSLDLLQTYVEGPADYLICAPSPGEKGGKRHEGEVVRPMRRDQGYTLVEILDSFESFSIPGPSRTRRDRQECWLNDRDLRPLPKRLKVYSVNQVDYHICAPTYAEYYTELAAQLGARTFGKAPELPPGWQRLKPGQRVRVLGGRGRLIEVASRDGTCWANAFRWEPLP